MKLINTGWDLIRRILKRNEFVYSVINRFWERKYFLTYECYDDNIPFVGNTYESWAEVAYFLIDPLIDPNKNGAYLKIPGLQLSCHSRKIETIEAFSRSFIGAAYLLKGAERSGHTKSLVRLQRYYMSGLIAGVDPGLDSYWGKADHLVLENCSLIIGLLLNKSVLWDKFSCLQKNLITNYFRKFLSASYYENNWLWAKVMHLLFLEITGGEDGFEKIMGLLDVLEQMYLGDGWYADGIPDKELHVDYYSAWAMQYYSLVFTILAPDRYVEYKKRYLDRAAQFVKSFQYFLSPGNIHVPFGRSQLYRFAAVAPIGLLLSQREDIGVDLSWLKTCVIDNVNTFLKSGILDRNGFLTMGLYGPNPNILETYSGSGSPYWAMKAFSFLMIPQEHRFWRTKANRTPVRGVYTIESTKQMLLHDGSSEVKLVNIGSKNKSHSSKYNKFAYSNVFLADYDDEEPFPDNSLLFKCSDKWRGFGGTIQASCTNNICSMVWHPEKYDKVKVASFFLGFPDGYVFIHKITSMFDLHFLLGGFIINLNGELEITMEDSSCTIMSSEGESSMSGLEICINTGSHSKFHTRSTNSTPTGQQGECPVFEGTLCGEKKGHVIGGWVWTSLNSERPAVPELIFRRDSVICENYKQERYIIDLKTVRYRLLNSPQEGTEVRSA